MRAGIERSTGRKVWHLLDSVCRSHKLVTRNTFSSELLAVVAAADDLMPLALTLHEVTAGPSPPDATRKLREDGSCSFGTILTTDSMSLWSAIAATTVKVPTEKHLAVYLFWLRQQLDTRSISVLRWSDTRDMTADCHTKGSVDRQAILNLMRGLFSFAHAVKDFTPRLASNVPPDNTNTRPPPVPRVPA